MKNFTNEKLQNLYSALLALYGEKYVGWQDIGSEEEIITFTVPLKNNYVYGEKKTINMTIWLDKNECVCYAIPMNSVEVNENYSVWAFEN